MATSNAQIERMERIWNEHYERARSIDERQEEDAETKSARLAWEAKRVFEPNDAGSLDHFIFMTALRRGVTQQEEADWALIRKAEARDDDERKAMAVRDDTTGGYCVSPDFAEGILHKLVDASPARQLSRVRVTGPGSPFIQPIRAGVPQAFHVDEVSGASRFDSAVDETFASANVPVHEVCVPILLSRALAQDARYPLEQELQQTFADSLAALEGAEFIGGTGNGQMLGLDNASLPAANVITAADATGHLIAPDDIARLLYQSGVKAAYLPQARLLMNPKTFGSIITAKGSSTAPGYLLTHSVQQSLFGVPVVACPEMVDVTATPAAGKKAVYLLNPLAYAMVVRADVSVLRLTQPFAHQGKLGLYFYARIGGQPVLPEAIGLLKTA